MIIGLQITAVIFSLIMIYFALLNYKRREINSVEFLSWIIIWTATVFIVVFPNLLNIFAKSFAFSRGFDMVVVGGFILLIPLIASSYVRGKRIERKVEKFIREEALKSVEKKSQNKK